MDSNAPRRILVVKLSSLGDLFCALPAARQIAAGLQATTDWVTQPEYVDLVRLFPGVERVLAYPRRNFLRDAGGFLRELRARRYDVAVDLQGLMKSALVTGAARALRKIGPSYAREGTRLFYPEVAGPLNRNRHAVEQALDTVRHLGLPAEPVIPDLGFPKAPRSEAGPRIALAPCSRWESKNWPVEYFRAVASHLQAETGATIFLIGGREDRAVCERIEKQLSGPVVNLCGKTSLVGLGSLLQEMQLVLTVDSGPMHMAAALGLPVLAVFCATDPARTGPYGPHCRVLAPPPGDCVPCHKRDCARQDMVCRTQVDPEDVFRAAMEMLGCSVRK